MDVFIFEGVRPSNHMQSHPHPPPPQISSFKTCGFVTYILSFPVAISFLVWAFVPDESLHSLGITYYPPKSVAVHLPAYILSLFVVVPLLYAGLNVLWTPRYDSLDTLWDGHSRKHDIAAKESEARDPTDAYAPKKHGFSIAEDESTVPEITDMDVFIINKMLLQKLKTSFS